MNVFIVFAHPSKNSFTYKILEQLQKGLQEREHIVEISDLYSMNFNSNMSLEEYQREGLVNLELPTPMDVKEEHRKIEKADCVIFLYPVWWSDCPAILKGWFDRVYTVGYAYGYDETRVNKMKKVKYGLVLCTAGHPNEFLEEIGIASSMKNVMLDDRLGVRFENKKMIIMGGTSDNKSDDNEHLKLAFNIGKNLKNYFE